MKKIVLSVLVIAILVAAIIVIMPFIKGFLGEYEYTDSTVSVILAEDFKEKLGADSITKVSYDYEMQIAEDGESAVVTIRMEVCVGDSSYTASAEGDLTAYHLPSGDILWEGPIDGEMAIGDKTEKLTVGFAKVESSGDVSVSVTFFGSACGFCFGEDIMKGEVLEFYKNKAGAK